MIDPRERNVIRELARRVADIAALPVQEQRRAMWRRHNRLERVRPLILIFPEGSWTELLPQSSLQCTDERLRPIENDLRQRIYRHEHFAGDMPVDGEVIVRKAFTDSGFGLQPARVDSAAERGAWAFDPVLKTPADLAKLRVPVITPDERLTADRLAFTRELLGDLLAVRLCGVQHISFHLMQVFTKLRGLAETMMDMVEQPAFVHDAMAFLEVAHRQRIEQWQRLGLLSPNNDGSYQNSGGVSYSTELPRSGCDPDRPRLSDLWASAETQEFAQVSPAMHEQFALQYERRLLAPFGLTGYGCCEDLTAKLGMVCAMPNMRRISISPFADVEKCAAQLGNRFIFSWKPHPSHVAGAFDPELIRRYLTHALNATRGCVIEIILKDTHTCDRRPERFDTWCRIASELVEKYA